MKSFVILGATKTGTSTAVAVANTHPSVFCLYECDFSRPWDSGRNADITRLLPATKKLFQNSTFSDGFCQIDKELRYRDWCFEWIGTKVPQIRPDLLIKIADLPVLFMVRDVRTWAVKNRIITEILQASRQTNIVPYLAAFASYYLSSFLIANCIRLPLETTFEPSSTVFPDALSRLLDQPRKPFEQWWDKSVAWKKTAPKNYSDWVEGHVSAFIPPFVSDTKSKLNQHPFWTEFLPLFDKYFLNPKKSYAKEEILNDQKLLGQIEKHHSMTVDEGFEQFDSFRLTGVIVKRDGEISINVNERISKIPGENWSRHY